MYLAFGNRGTMAPSLPDCGEAAGVIEMQMAGQHDVDVFDGQAGLGERVIEVIAAIELVDLRALRVHLVAAPGVDDHRVLVAAHDQRPHAQRNAVRIVWRQPFLPQLARHHAEHGAAIEREEPVRQA